jgi:AraC-like DNA-binding protein
MPPVTEHARFIRPPKLSGVEALHATFVSHRYPPHLHDAWTLAHVVSGAARFQLEGRWQTAPAGTSFLIAPGVVHTGESASAAGYSYRVLYVGPERLRERSEREPAPRRLGAPVLVRRDAFAQALMSMHEILAMPQMALEQGEALAHVMRELDGLLGCEPAPSPERARPTIEAARAYIHAHCHEDFTLDDLGRAVGFSVFHLVRTFRKEIGMPPSAYRRALRVQAAQHLLKAGTPPARAATECGFYAQAHLNRHFKRVTGVTPAVYMRAERSSIRRSAATPSS